MTNVKNGRKFSAEFNKATEVNGQTRLLAQTPNEPVEYVDLEQVAEVVNEGMATQADLNTTNGNVATNAGNIQTLQNEVDNRYTKEQTDAQISEAINEVEQTIEEIEQTNKDTYATKTGEYKELTAGFAYEILGDGQATSEMFSFRPTGGPNRNVRDGSARIEVLKGNSVVWNQLVDNNALFVGEKNGVVISKNEDGSITFNGTASNVLVYNLANVKIPVAHKLALTGVDNMPSFTFFINGGSGLVLTSSGILTCSNEGTSGVMFLYFNANTTFNNVTIRPKIHYLTKMFGAGDEPTTLEQFYELLPKVKNINAYNEGEIVDANYKAIKTTGFNQWDEQWVGGYYQGADGQFVPSPNDLANKNPIPIIGGMPYYFKQINSSGGLIRVLFYDHNMHYIAPRLDVAIQGQKVIAPVNAAYCNFFVGGLTTYNNDICVNIAWDEYSALNGQYKPYKPFERDLSWVAKYFPNGSMRSAGNVADELRFNSTTQQWEAVPRVGVVDLGSLTWEKQDRPNSTIAWRFRAKIDDSIQSGVLLNMLCDKYITNISSIGEENVDDSIIIYNGYVYVEDTSYTDATSFTTEMAGVMLNYELATPIVTPITEDVNLAYDVADYGTEQLIVADGAQSAPLSAEVVYEPNVLASIKQVAAMLTRLDALETAVATMQASAVATTNEE